MEYLYRQNSTDYKRTDGNGKTFSLAESKQIYITCSVDSVAKVKIICFKAFWGGTIDFSVV